MIIVGTANREEFLRDETGDSRFLVVNIGNADVDVEGVERDREQLFAEAYHRRTESTWLEGEAKRLAIVHQDAAKELDPWEGLIDYWLRERRTENPITILQVLQGPLKFEPSHIKRSDQQRAGACLRRLGLTRHNTGTRRVWLIPRDYPRDDLDASPF